MITCVLQGGLGNQLFQIFTTISYALKCGIPFFFMDKKQLGNGENGSTIRYTYFDSFLSNLKIFIKDIPNMSNPIYVKEKGFNYDINLLGNFLETDVILYGYFQSPKYFDKYKESIFKLIKLDSNKIIVKAKCKTDIENVVSMHFRMGDYKNYPDVHPILPASYYRNALKSLLDENIGLKKVLYFCEDIDLEDVMKIINDLQQEFKYISFERADSNLSDWEQMLLMSLCTHNIIANSTFSWWSAYLNKNVSKIVYYPELWFGSNMKHDTSDLFPEEWVKISI